MKLLKGGDYLKYCDGCFWRKESIGDNYNYCALKDKIVENKICPHYAFHCNKCGVIKGDYIYKQKYYCKSCLVDILGLEESITTSYYKDGQFLGTGEDFEEVLNNLMLYDDE